MIEAYFTDLVFSQLAITKEQQASIPITVVPIVVSVINTIIPKIIIKLVETEAWDNKMDEVEQIVFRIFISKTIILQATHNFNHDKHKLRETSH